MNQYLKVAAIAIVAVAIAKRIPITAQFLA